MDDENTNDDDDDSDDSDTNTIVDDDKTECDIFLDDLDDISEIPHDPSQYVNQPDLIFKSCDILSFLVIHSMQEETNGKNNAQAKDINNATSTPGINIISYDIFSYSSINFSGKTRTNGKSRGE